ncbi:MAG: efflux transporter outer membrane subunit [Pseudomonadota bacterium]
MSAARRISCSALVGLLLTGCAVGTDYTSPAQDETAGWQHTDAVDAAMDDAWWQRFGDTTLDTLVAQALEENRNLRTARWQVVEAQAGSAAAQGARLPALALDARYTNFEQSIESPQSAGPLIRAGVVPRTGEFYTVSGLASWELDPFGGLKRAAQAAGAREDAALANADGVALQVVSETVNAYSDWINFSRRATVAARNVELQQNTLNVIEGKVRLGLSRKLDAERAISELKRLQASLPQLTAQRDAARERLAVLVGRTSADLATILPSLAQTDAPQDDGITKPADSRLSVPDTIAVGTPASVLRRRPDVRAAERQLAAATATTGQALAAFFPSLTLTASGGFEAEKTSELSSGNARAVGIVPFVRWPLFQGGQLRAQLRAAKAREQQALAGYEQSVLQALADTESAIVAFEAAGIALDRLRESRAAAARAELLARRLYREGLVDFLSLLDAQRQLASIDDAALAAEGQLVLAAVRLYKSLGGDWDFNQPS